MNDPVTAGELTSEQFTDLYDAVRHLRPTWLRDLGGVFANGHRVEQSPIQWLRSTPTGGVTLIEIYECDDAIIHLSVSRCVSSRYLDVSFRR